MQVGLLNSIIKITKNKDVDSLEYTIISTIQEFVKCEEISIYKDLEVAGELRIERSASLKFLSQSDFIWQDKDVIKEPDAELVSCISSSCIITVKSDNNKERRWLPINVRDKPVAVIAILSQHLESEDQVLLNAFCRIFENYLAILHESETDKLTGLLNRQTFDKKIKLLIEKQMAKQHQVIKTDEKRSKHSGSSSWLAIVDIDHFKQVNDEYGHVCGDEVLLLLAQKMKSYFRSSDLIFRFGGEEFVLVFEPTNYDFIQAKLNTFLDLVRNTKFPFVSNLSLSIGLSRISPYDFPISVVENADKALYYAKRNGRDQLCFYDELVTKNLIDTKEKQSDIDLF